MERMATDKNSGVPWSMAYAPSEQTGISKYVLHQSPANYVWQIKQLILQDFICFVVKTMNFVCA